MAHSEFVRFLLEQLQPSGNVQARCMSGGFDLYSDSLTFALVANDILYLKVDPETVATIDHLGLDALSYRNNRGPLCVMSYRAAPAEALNDSGPLRYWMQFGLARRAHASTITTLRTRRNTS